MRTAVDTNVLLDVFLASAKFGAASREAIHRAHSEGSLVACDVVWAEACGQFRSRSAFDAAMSELQVFFDPCDAETALLAGETWRKYRERGGRRSALVADFLIAAHALVRADRLLTRDRGFVRRYSPRLVVLSPSE